MDSSFLLILLLVTPLAGAVIGGFLSDAAARGWALLISLATFGISIYIAMQFFAGVNLAVHPPSALSPESRSSPPSGPTFPSASRTSASGSSS